MNFSKENARADRVWFDQDNLWLSLIDGRKLSVPRMYFKSFQDATDEQLSDYVLSGNGIGIHWDSIDEDIYVPNLLIVNPKEDEQKPA